MATIGEQIKKYRNEAHLSQKQLADRLGISQQMIAQYETGKRIPKIDTINNIAGALEMGVRRLYPDFTFTEWQTSETYKQAAMRNSSISAIIKLLSNIYGEIEEVVLSDDNNCQPQFIINISGNKNILTMDHFEILFSYLNTTLPFFINAFMSDSPNIIQKQDGPPTIK